MQNPSHATCIVSRMQPGLVSQEPGCFDVLLQTVHQDKAHRLCLYAAAKDLRAWPPTLADEVVEVGPHTPHKGPCLVLLRNCRLSPVKLLSWINGGFLRRAIMRIYFLPSLPTPPVPALQGNAAASSSAPAEGAGGQLLGAAGSQDSACTSDHVHQQASASPKKEAAGPGQQQVPHAVHDQTLSSKEELLASILRAGPPPGPMRIVGYPRSLEPWVGDNLPLSYEFHPHQNQYVLFVVQLQVPPEPPAWSQHRQQGGNHPQDLNAGRSSESGGQGDSRQPTTTGSVHAQQGQEQGDNEGGAAVAKKAGKKQWQQPPPQYQYRWGYAPSAWFYKMLADEPKQFAFEGGVASAVNKIAEALHVFGIPHGRQPAAIEQESDSLLPGQDRRRRVAIDVGAAPGSWTAYLAGVYDMVIAVDPAQLHPSVLALPGVHHVRLNSRHPDVVPLIHKLLQTGGGDTRQAGTSNSGDGAGDSKGAMAATTIREEVLPSESAGNGVAEQGCSQDQLADLLVCDMNARPWLVREPIKDLLQFLRPGGHVVMTLKMNGTGQDNRQDVVDRLADYFKDELEGSRWCWLLANTMYEGTWVARKRT